MWRKGQPDREGRFDCVDADGTRFAITIEKSKENGREHLIGHFDDGGVVPHWRWDSILAYFFIPPPSAKEYT